MSARFRKALEGLDSRNWQLFEEVASKFMADEFSSLRSLADRSGDGGRDGVLLSPADYPTVAVQYSVSENTSVKIRATAARLNDAHPEITNLIYLTPRTVPTAVKDAEGVHLRKNHRLHLDIRDASWFVDREERSQSTRTAADLAGRVIVDPLLANAGLLKNATQELSSEETRAALLFLTLQREDDDQNRGLTKLCFDALVRAVLRGTDNTNLLTRVQVHAAVRQLVPSHDESEVAEYTDRALTRLERGAVRHWPATDSFCLSYEERTRLVEAMVGLAELESHFDADVRQALEFVVTSMEAGYSAVEDTHVQRVRRVLEACLFEQGESFVAALAQGQPPLFIEGDLSTFVMDDAAKVPDGTSLRNSIVPITEEAIRRLIFEASEATIAFLHAAKEAYTLFAFLRESPNVQAAVSKVFSGGEVWLDTTVLLPLLAEHLVEPEHRSYRRLFEAARSAGVSLYATEGVVEEISSHFDRCRAAIRHGSNFRGRSPFLLNAFVWSGGLLPEFPRFETVFRGDRHPEADLAEYLKDELGVVVASLSKFAADIDDELRWATQEYWREAHSARRSGQDQIDPDMVERLARHDAESFLGVIKRRGGELIDNPLGYRTWWLTVDSSAIVASDRIAQRAGIGHIDTPVMGLAFLTYYLMAGDVRRQLSREQARHVPALLDTTFMDVMPKDLAAAADKVRVTMEGSNPRVMRRQIRDILESDRIRSGRIGRIGIESIQYDIEMSLKKGN